LEEIIASEAGQLSVVVGNTGGPLQRVMLFEALAARIEEWILSGGFENGARLPSEGSLAKEFGVSRPVVREGLARLRERGLVETVSGSGTFVRHPDPNHLVDAFLRHLRLATANDGAVRNLYDARIAIEVAAAQLAASKAEQHDREQIRRHLEAMKKAGKNERRWTIADLSFHLAVAAASHNPFLSTLIEPLVKAIQHCISESYRSPQAVERALAAHDEIATAIEARDAESAGTAMRRHLLESQRYFSRVFSSSRRGDDLKPEETTK